MHELTERIKLARPNLDEALLKKIDSIIRQELKKMRYEIRQQSFVHGADYWSKSLDEILGLVEEPNNFGTPFKGAKAGEYLTQEFKYAVELPSTINTIEFDGNPKNQLNSFQYAVATRINKLIDYLKSRESQ